LPSFTIVGLPDESCREARDRVRAAVLSSGLTWPQQRITVNLAPSNLRKVGSSLDLAIAVGVLEAVGALPDERREPMAWLAELGLDGTLRPIPGIVPMAAVLGDRALVVAPEDTGDAALVGTGAVRCARTLAEVVEALHGRAPWPDPPPGSVSTEVATPPDLAEVRGHAMGRLALEVAAAGMHHLLMVGPPGSGKTLMAQRLPGLLPPLDSRTSIEATMAHSAVGATRGLITVPPLRSPHHSCSTVALIGGGSAAMRPGEIALAHGGVLLLDEMAEFSPSALDALRQPLESGMIRIDRARSSAEYPARFLLVGTMNPCPCGDGDRPGSCRCTDATRERYARRVSGPILDRFDLRILVHRAEVEDLMDRPEGECSAVVAERVAAARTRAAERGVVANSLLTSRQIEHLAPLEPLARRMVRAELVAGRLSARGLHRVRRVARTIADLRGEGDRVSVDSLSLALQLRVDVLPRPGR
ncbi:MAG: YifB family Mg chelatase-like AAA ATPase, partial [Acidimicrobiia bacterium]